MSVSFRICNSSGFADFYCKRILNRARGCYSTYVCTVDYVLLCNFVAVAAEKKRTVHLRPSTHVQYDITS